MEKVKVTNMSNSRVVVNVPEVRFNRQWMAKGAAATIEKDTLEELMYDPGFKYMIDTGILYIEDLEVKKELGIEPEDATEPVNVIVLSDTERQNYLKVLSLTAFKKKVQDLNLEQINALADYAIEHKIVDVDKCKVLKELCGRDIIQAIRLNEQDKEG